MKNLSDISFGWSVGTLLVYVMETETDWRLWVVLICISVGWFCNQVYVSERTSR